MDAQKFYDGWKESGIKKMTVMEVSYAFRVTHQQATGILTTLVNQGKVNRSRTNGQYTYTLAK